MIREARKTTTRRRCTGRTWAFRCTVAAVLFAALPGNDCSAADAYDAGGIRIPGPRMWAAQAAPLRAVVTQFTGKREGREVRLHWVTARESGNRGFEVQRASSLSRGWERLTFVPGFGSSTMEQDYHFTDRGAPPEDVRYMLRIIGQDGVVQYSQIIAVPAGSMLKSFTARQVSDEEEKVFRASVELTEAGVTALSVIDGKGLTLLRVMAATRLEAGRHEFIVDCSKVPRGEYTLMLHIPEGRFSRRLAVP